MAAEASSRARRKQALPQTRKAALVDYHKKIAGQSAYDEMFNRSGKPRWGSLTLNKYFKSADFRTLFDLQKNVNAAIESLGITFSIGDADKGIDRAWPLDVLPRVIDEPTWDATASALSQRLRALNMFIDDCYNEQRVLKDKIVPRELVLGSSFYLKQCRGARPAHGAWVNICGTDLARHPNSSFVVIEDNLRIPSGIAYMVENREVMYRVASEMYESERIHPVDKFPRQLYRTLASLSSRPGQEPTIVVYTPGIYNSAYFEHVFLARQMGVPLVQAQDMVVLDDIVYLQTINGLVQVDVIYRRVDEQFIDPRAFRKDSLLGVPGLMKAWRRGRVSIANSPGTGIADDKSLYSYVPALIKYYLDEDSLLPSLRTYKLDDKTLRDEAFRRTEELVFKPVTGAGGHGVVIGCTSSKKELESLKRRVLANPSQYIAQELCVLSTAPTLVRRSLEPCHVDLRPFVLQGEEGSVSAGGLTRVASKPGKLIINSSQGGGSKDTWVVGKS